MQFFAVRKVATRRAFGISSSGRMSMIRPSPSPGTGAIRVIAASPVSPLPRLMRISTVSAWSSRVCAVRMCEALALRPASASRR